MNENKPVKLFLKEHDLMLDGFRLGKRVFDSGYYPDFIVGLWRGGSAVGIVVQECLQYLGVDTDHISIRTSYRGAPTYEHMVDNAEGIRVHGMQYLYETMNASDRLLIVDDVYSTGLSIKAVIDKLSVKMRKNTPKDIKVAVPWYKPQRNRTDRVPDYYIHETASWLVLPYELAGLSVDEICAFKEGLKPVLKSLTESP